MITTSEDIRYIHRCPLATAAKYHGFLYKPWRRGLGCWIFNGCEVEFCPICGTNLEQSLQQEVGDDNCNGV